MTSEIIITGLAAILNLLLAGMVGMIFRKIDNLDGKVSAIQIAHAGDKGSGEASRELMEKDLENLKERVFEKFARLEASDQKQWSLLDRAHGRTSDG